MKMSNILNFFRSAPEPQEAQVLTPEQKRRVNTELNFDTKYIVNGHSDGRVTVTIAEQSGRVVNDQEFLQMLDKAAERDSGNQDWAQEFALRKKIALQRIAQAREKAKKAA